MSQCIVDRKLIQEKIFSEAFNIDENVLIINDKIIFSDKENFEKFKKSMSNLFDVNGLEDTIKYIDDTLTAVIDNTDLISEMAAFEKPHAAYNVTAVGKEYYIHPSNIKFYNDYLKKIKLNIKKLSIKIKQLNEDYKNANTDNERKEIERQRNQYYIVRQGLKEQLEKVELNVSAITDKIEKSKKMLEYILSNFNKIKDPNLVETIIDIFDDIDNFIDMLGDKKYSSKEYPIEISSSDKIKLQQLRSDINALKLSFDRLIDQYSRNFLTKNPILISNEKMREILKDPTSEEYKRMFGGAAITDINFLERLGLNVDTSSTFDGVLGQVIHNHSDMIAQDNLNECYDKKRKFMSLAKRMKDIGINLESEKDVDFIFEKDKHGNKTGYIIDVFSYEFKTKRRDFAKAVFNKETANVLNFIKKDFQYLDIFKFSIFNGIPKDGIAKECYECCEQIFKEVTGKDTGFKEWLAKRGGTDIVYENKMKDMLGEKQLNEIQEQMMSYIIEYYYSNQGNINNTQHKNPFKIIECIDRIKSGKSVDTTFNGKMYYFTSFDMIPKNESEYNIDFRKNFIENKNSTKDLFNEFYNFIYDNYLLFNLLYNGKNTLRSAFFKVNAVDETFDAIKGIAHLDDVGSNMRKIKEGALQWIGEQFWDNDYITSDDTRVSLNYIDKAEQKYQNIIKLLNTKSKDEIDKIAKDNNINKNDYSDANEYKKAIAKKISLEGYNQNFYEVTMKMFDLYAAQKTRNEVYPIAKTIERLYNQYTNEKGNKRENACARYKDYVMRSIQKIKLDDADDLNVKLSNISFVRNFLSRFDQMPIVSKFLNTKLMKNLSDDEKELVNAIKEAKKHINDDTDVTFVYDDEEYMRAKSGGIVKYYKKIGDEFVELKTQSSINDFKNTLAKYYDRQIAALGSDATLQNVINLIRSLMMYKMLAGVSTSGMFNRIEGHLANSEMDATGYYWTPGNLNYVEQYFLGSSLLRYITKSGEKIIVKYFGADNNSKWIKRMEIVRKISDRTNIFQDMKNQFDRTIEGAQKGVNRHNFDIFQLAVNNPEFKNQMTVILSMLLDVEIKDKKGNVHKIFDKKTGEFTCYDIVNNELVLKDEFDIPENQCWINFNSVVKTIIDGEEVKVISKSFDFAQRCKSAIKDIHGDYRKNAALGYNNNILLSMIMTLKRWMPSKIQRGWSKGGSELDGAFQESYNLFGGSKYGTGKTGQTGLWRDALEKGKSPLTMMLPVILSTFRLHKGVFQTLAGAGGSIYIIGSIIKNKLGAKKGEIESNISMLDETIEIMKALTYEIAIYIPRNIPRVFGKTFDASKHSFTDEKYSNEYGDVTLGNFRACARQMATYFYISALGIMAKLLFWNPDDGDDDDRRKMFNWMDNNLENILSALTSTLFMIDNIEDKADVSNIPIIRLYGDLKKFVNAANEMNTDKMIRYGEKVFLPIRFPSLRNHFNPFESDFEYEKDTWDDRWIKNIKTDGEWGAEQTYKHIRADIKRQYVLMWEKEELPDYAIDMLDKQLKKTSYDSIYDVPESVFKDMVSKSMLIPSRKQKEYRERDYKFMHDVLMEEYENNPYLKNHSLRFIFGGYDNRIGSYFQRIYNSDYEIIRDNPYIDDGD